MTMIEAIAVVIHKANKSPLRLNLTKRPRDNYRDTRKRAKTSRHRPC